MRRVGVLLVLLLVMLLALAARLTHLDSAAGLSGASYDEAVWAWAARLFLHGVLPYRDYFFPQPPAAAFVFSPAMLLDSSTWGSPESFLAARQLSVVYGLISVALVLAIGHRLGGWWGATAAAVVWSLDPRVAGLSAQVLLDGPMLMLSFAAILAYLAVHPALAPGVPLRRQLIGLAVAGGLAALSALIKVVGVTVLLAIVLDLVWRRVGRRTEPPVPLVALLGSLLLGAGAVFAMVLTPFIIASRGEVLSQAVFFQLLRPGTTIGLMDRIGQLWQRPDLVPILVIAGLGLAAVTISAAIRVVWATSRRPNGGRPSDGRPVIGPKLAGWGVLVLWAALNALVFISTHTFFPHYQLHLLAALALLAAGVGLIPLWLRGVPRASTLIRRWELPTAILLLFVLAALQAPSWRRTADGNAPEYMTMSRYLRASVPADAQVLTLDARVAFLAGRAPSRDATGYLVDPFGHLVFLGLELADRAPVDLLLAVVRGEVHDWNSVVASRRAQADVLARIRDADFLVVHRNERWRLGPSARTVDAIAARVEQHGNYLVYVMGPSAK